MKRPEVSVLLPFRNAEATLRGALESVLRNQVPLEVLAIDDGSDDQGRHIAEALARRDDRIRVLGGCFGGIATALEFGRSNARAPLLARMDGDDISLPGRLDRQWEAMKRNPRLGALGTQVELFDAPTPGMERYVAWQNDLTSAEAHHRALFIEAPLCHPSTMLRATAVEDAGGYRAGDFPEDYDLWLRLDERAWALEKLPEVLLHWRRWPGQSTFEDPRYRPEAFRALKVAHIGRRIPDRPLAVWGAGVTGKRFMRTLEPEGFKASFWIDIDPRKIGGQRRGAPIHPKEHLRSKEAFLLVALGSLGARGEAQRWLENEGFEEGRDYLCVA